MSGSFLGGGDFMGAEDFLLAVPVGLVGFLLGVGSFGRLSTVVAGPVFL